jgi:hypothetical protein
VRFSLVPYPRQAAQGFWPHRSGFVAARYLLLYRIRCSIEYSIVRYRDRKYVPMARACVARFTRAIPRSACTASRALNAKICLSKFFLILILAKYGHILDKTRCSGPMRQPGRQAHGGTALALRHHVRCP